MGLRYAALAFAPIALAGGLAGGLWRLGWELPGGIALAALHGPLMISGLFGTLISLERAVALGMWWAYAAPVLSASGTAMLLAGAPSVAAASFYLGAATALAIGSGLIVRTQPTLFTVVLLFGASAWAVGNYLWLVGAEIPRLVGWWIAFLLLTIAGERLEMSRLLPTRAGSSFLFAISAGSILAGAFQGLDDHEGVRIYGFGLLATALWLLRHDIARHNVRTAGATRYFAVCMLAGYAWLGIAGVFMLAGALPAMTFGYDVALHTVLVGFVLSMVFGHALIILPAVSGVKLSYSAQLYGPLALLHGSLAMRVGGGLLDLNLVRQWSGVVTTIALLSFPFVVGWSTALARHRSRRA